MRFILFLFFICCSNSYSKEIKFGQNRKPTSESALFAFTGDILIHDALYLKVLNSESKDFSQLWTETIPLFQKADFAYGNLEGPTALGINNQRKDVGDVGFTYDKIVYSGTNFVFNYHPRIIKDLQNSGLDILSTANNHTYDRGSIGIDKTIDAMNEAGMAYIGTRKKGSTDSFITYTTVKNIKVAWISCTEALNGFIDKFSQTLLCYQQSKEIISLIDGIVKNKSADAIFVTPHWGIEYQHEPSVAQKKHAELFLEAGATAIIGSHPHVLQPAKKYTTKDQRETFIAYSLGNFAAYQKNIERKASAVVYLSLSKDADGKTWISDYFYEPTLRNGTEIFHAKNNKEAINHIEQFLGPYRR